jgi:hypothetical protein
MGKPKRIAPIFPVRDLSVSLRHYQRLGFATRVYDKGGYGFATLDHVEIHLDVVVPGGTATAPASRACSSKTPASWLRHGPRQEPMSEFRRTLSGDSTRASSSTRTGTSFASAPPCDAQAANCNKIDGSLLPSETDAPSLTRGDREPASAKAPIRSVIPPYESGRRAADRR